MADKGYSLRLEHVTYLRRKPFAPRTGVPAKDLELAVALWEKEVFLYEDASGELFLAENRKMSLTDMCPLGLRQRIKDFGPERFGTYEAIRVEVYNWLAENLHQSNGKLAAIAEAPEVEEMDLEMTHEQFGGFLLDPVSQAMPAEQFMAMVKNVKLKRNKGDGKVPKAQDLFENAISATPKITLR